jgi:hypothetical protein
LGFRFDGFTAAGYGFHGDDSGLVAAFTNSHSHFLIFSVHTPSMRRLILSLYGVEFFIGYLIFYFTKRPKVKLD